MRILLGGLLGVVRVDAFHGQLVLIGRHLWSLMLTGLHETEDVGSDTHSGAIQTLAVLQGTLEV